MPAFEQPKSLGEEFTVPDFQVQEKLAARRRKAAQDLLDQGNTDSMGGGYQGGKVFIVGNPLGNIAKSIGGAYMSNKADQADASEAQQLQSIRQELLRRMPSEQKAVPAFSDEQLQAGPQDPALTPMQGMRQVLNDQYDQ